MKRYNLASIIFQLFVTLILLSIVTVGCDKDKDSDNKPDEEIPVDTTVTLDPSEVDTSKIYIPVEFRSSNWYKSSSQWYYGRSKQSEHFIVFWDIEYGNNDPNSTAIPEALRVDIDDLLEKAEGFYDINVNQLKFAETGIDKSNLDNYKMMIFIFYQTDWMATGAGYDDVIGALWVNPGTCHPVGSVIAHEIGHSFQYQVYCDLGGKSGYRYGFGGNGGNAFWEQTAQWQSLQSYPEQAFTTYDFPEYMDNYHRHICHEWQRYASYWIHYYWADKHGIDFIGKLWRMAEEPEDPMQTYMRITDITVAELNAELYDAATKFVTWDLDAIRDLGENYIGQHKYGLTTLTDGSYRVTYERCPGSTGYNVIPLNVPASGTVISTQFTGLYYESGFNPMTDVKRAGWRYGYVALLEDGTRIYSDMYDKASGIASFTVPDNCSKIWFVVTGAPNTYQPHPWDEDESNDDQWPYKIKFTNTDLYGNVTFDGSETPKDTTLTYNIKFPFSSSVYPGATVTADFVAMAYAFVLQPTDISSKMGSSIKFYAVESDSSLNSNTTANGYGHWFDANGDVIAWGTGAQVYSEYDESKFTFTIGQYPGHCASGDKYTIKQALVYEYETGMTVQTTFVFHITIE
ncbi:MAG: DUF4859 domain-containing protein [Bacteroidales bacterium]|nr:DUF4859 domain-containing protein [Bacteroidales bacterium]